MKLNGCKVERMWKDEKNKKKIVLRMETKGER